MTECPDDGLLEQFVQGRISSSEERALEDHIGQCSSCQKRLESLAAEQFTTDFGSRPVLLSDSEPHYEALNRAIQHLRSNKPNAHSDSRSLDGPGRTQRERLLKEAEQRWLEAKKAPTIRQELLWARLLGSTDRKREAIDFLLERVINTGDRLDQRKFLARMLEQERRYRDAQIQWSAVEHFNPNDPDAAAARERINNIK
ncbi:MAG TPA: hypothetical protein DCG12_05415 [Planctomycetaceae bacterium]|nr:hypothetical protein [Planctomycetaceae bacterium]